MVFLLLGTRRMNSIKLSVLCGCACVRVRWKEFLLVFRQKCFFPQHRNIKRKIEIDYDAVNSISTTTYIYIPNRYSKRSSCRFAIYIFRLRWWKNSWPMLRLSFVYCCSCTASNIWYIEIEVMQAKRQRRRLQFALPKHLPRKRIMAKVFLSLLVQAE